MEKWQVFLISVLCCIFMGNGSCQKDTTPTTTNPLSQTSSSSDPTTSTASTTLEQAQSDYYTKIGIGANLAPHFEGTDKKNNEYQASVPSDVQQLQEAGFQTVRAYGDPAKDWIALINAAKNNILANGQVGANGASTMGVVYQVAVCKGDAGTSDHKCLNITGSTFEAQLAFNKTQLQQVITEVGAATFQQVVKLILVGNEDFVLSTEDGTTYSTDLLIAAISDIKDLLTQNNIKVADGSGSGIDISSSVEEGNMLSSDATIKAEVQRLVSAFTPGAPIVINIYPFQWGKNLEGGNPNNDPTIAMNWLKGRITLAQQRYPNNPIMIGETGWPTAGSDSGYADPDATGSLEGAKTYFKDLYAYVKEAKIPLLAFEAFDEPTKLPIKAGDAEKHYGVFNSNNTVKDSDNELLPNSQYAGQYDSTGAALFTFTGWENSTRTEFSPLEIIFQVTNPGQKTFTQKSKPFYQSNPPPTEKTLIWPTLALYAGSQVKISFTKKDGTSTADSCQNSVLTVEANSEGGTWKCDKSCAGNGCSGIEWNSDYHQNVWLHPDW
jgi:exo-beta-1,3-glucanase (GH17 family)